jgi:putative ABC transport system ATP-binding protein
MLLQATNIAVSRKGSPVLRFADLSLAEGGRLLLLGPSGSGKTTLLSVLAGLLPPDAGGKVSFAGQDIYALPPRARDRLRGRDYGFVFQTLHLLPSLSLRQNVALAATLAGAPESETRIDPLLAALGLADKARRRPEALSQGEQQRAAIARAVLNRPRLIIADEPTSALDDANAMAVMELIERQAAETGAALLIATHDNRITNRFENVMTLDHRLKEAA